MQLLDIRPWNPRHTQPSRPEGLHLGMGLRATHIRKAERRDRMLVLVAIAHTLLTLLGAASEASGLDHRILKVNTSSGARTRSIARASIGTRRFHTCGPIGSAAR
jgi:hypothetical protein